MDGGKDNRPPRGALAVVAIGLFATFAAAWLSTDEPIGAVELGWEAKTPLPDSRTAQVPGGGQMRLAEAGIRATAPNAGGYRLYRVAAVLKVDEGSAVGQGRVRCSIRVPRPTIVAHTPGSRGSYPRSSSGEDLTKQDVPDEVLIEFASHGSDIGAVELGDAFDTFTTIDGVVVSWAPFQEGAQRWQWGLPPGQPGEPLELGFASVWRTTGTPSAQISCTLETSAGKATVHTSGTLSTDAA